MRSEHDVLSALEHLELSAERAWGATEVRARYGVEHHLAGSSDAQCQRPELPRAPTDPEIGRERAADDEGPEKNSCSRNPGERADPHDSFFVRSIRLLAAFGLGYLLGTVQSADVVSRFASDGRVNLRESGSRNPGAVNAGRVLGATAGRAVLVADVAPADAPSRVTSEHTAVAWPP